MHKRSIIGEVGTCLDDECICHTDKKHRVQTPFPADVGPCYCCNYCSSERATLFAVLTLLGVATPSGRKKIR